MSGNSVLYISGEESLRQIKLRAERIGEFNENLQLLCETNLETIREVIERKKPDMVVIDSIQTMFHEDIKMCIRDRLMYLKDPMDLLWEASACLQRCFPYMDF